MKQFISTIFSFLQTVIAGGIRLAALKKAGQGSSKLHSFAQKMTNTKFT